MPSDKLKRYRAKRDFRKTTEPEGAKRVRGDPPEIVELVVQGQFPRHPAGGKGHDQVMARTGCGR